MTCRMRGASRPGKADLGSSIGPERSVSRPAPSQQGTVATLVSMGGSETQIRWGKNRQNVPARPHDLHVHKRVAMSVRTRPCVCPRHRARRSNLDRGAGGGHFERDKQGSWSVMSLMGLV